MPWHRVSAHQTPARLGRATWPGPSVPKGSQHFCEKCLLAWPLGTQHLHYWTPSRHPASVWCPGKRLAENSLTEPPTRVPSSKLHLSPKLSRPPAVPPPQGWRLGLGVGLVSIRNPLAASSLCVWHGSQPCLCHHPSATAPWRVGPRRREMEAGRKLGRQPPARPTPPTPKCACGPFNCGSSITWPLARPLRSLRPRTEVARVLLVATQLGMWGCCVQAPTLTSHVPLRGLWIESPGGEEPRPSAPEILS